MQNKKQDTSLVNRFRYYIDLSDQEEQLLDELEKDEISFKSRVKLHLQDLNSNLYVLKSGWLYRYVDLPDGGRQMLRIYLPGEIVGLDDVTMEDSFNHTMTASDVVISPFPKQALETIFRNSPRLSALLFSLGMLEKAILLDRIKMIGRHSALNCVANFMVEIHSRLKLHSDSDEFKTFNMPLTQENIADALGLTNVTVSNALSQLEKDNKISYQRNTVTIHDPDLLKQQLGYNDRHFRIDTSWFPK